MAKCKVKKVPVDFDAIKSWFDDHLSTSKCNFEDQKPYEVYEKGNWGGIFQCVDESTLVSLASESSVSGLNPEVGKKAIKDIVVGDMVLAYDEDHCDFAARSVTEVYDQGERDCCDVVFSNGTRLTCTPDHRVYSFDAMLWRQVQNCLGHEVPTTSGTALIVELVPVGKRHVYDIEVEDVHSFFANGIAVHNCTGRGAQQLFMKAKPKSIVDIAALTSIYRPGPLAAKVDDLWLKHACEHYDWGHPLINETLKETRGLLIFQEGVMSLANKVAGFPLEKCDEVRRAIMKRSIAGGEAAKKKTKELEDSIVDGAVKNGVPRNIAEKMYETITWMSGYGFNKSLYFLERVNTYSREGKFVAQKEIQHVISGDWLESRDEKTGDHVLVEVVDKHDHGMLDLVEVELNTGEKVRCTWDHKFRTIETKEMLPLWMIQKLGLSIVVNDVAKFSQEQNITKNT
jgi:hypothetical protein